MRNLNLNQTKVFAFMTSVLLLSLVLNACSPKDTTKPLDKEEEKEPDIPANSIQSFEYPGVWKADFKYEKGLLSKIIWGGTDTMDVTYTGDYISEMKSSQQITTVQYNQNTGQLMEFSFNAFPNTQRIIYSYSGSEDQPSGYIWMGKKYINGSWQDDTSYIVKNLQYNGAGGLVSAEVKNFSAGAVFEATFELENKQNVFFDNTALHTLPHFIDGAYGLTKVSKQIINTITFKKGGQINTVVKFNYTWDPDVDHLPVKITYTPDSSPTDKFFVWNK